MAECQTHRIPRVRPGSLVVFAAEEVADDAADSQFAGGHEWLGDLIPLALVFAHQAALVRP